MKSSSSFALSTAQRCKSWWSRTSTCLASILANHEREQSQPCTCNFVAKSAWDQPLATRSRRTVGPTAFIGRVDVTGPLPPARDAEAEEDETDGRGKAP